MLIRKMPLLIFCLGIFFSTIFFAILALCSVCMPYAWRYNIITSWSHFFIFWVKIICGLRYHVTGLENLPKTPSVVVLNHQSVWETIFMQVILPSQSCVLKKELLLIPFFGWGLRLLEPIPVDREDNFSVKALLCQGRERLQRGRWVIIYPEGTRVIVGKKKKYSRTAAALALASNVPIIPIVHNAGKFWPISVLPRYSGIIRVHIGPEIDAAGCTASKVTNMAQEWIEQQYLQLKS